MWKPELGVCSWSLQASSVPELVKLMDEVGAGVVHLGLGDPTHGTWKEGKDLAKAIRAAHLDISATMIGYPGEDYTSPETIRRTGGFGDPALREERLKIFRAAVDQTAEMGIKILASHAGFIPDPESPDRGPFLDTLAEAAEYAASRGVIFALETGQETAELLRRTLDELAMDNLKVNFDPANMILYDMGDPIRAVKILGADIVHVHAKDARPPEEPGVWGEEVPLGEGDVDFPAFLEALEEVDYSGPIAVEREVGDQRQRVADIRKGIQYLRKLLTEG